MQIYCLVKACMFISMFVFYIIIMIIICQEGQRTTYSFFSSLWGTKDSLPGLQYVVEEVIFNLNLSRRKDLGALT